jgi:thermostable 8-oxoguanine DNA glycosylase
MFYNSENHITTLDEVDYSKLLKITKHLIHQVNMPQLGIYSSISQDELWLNLVLQFCVVSGKRMAEDLRSDEKKLHEFGKKLNFRYLISLKNNRKNYIANILKSYKATSFYNKQAERIEDVLRSPEVIHHNKLIFVKDINYERQSHKEIRDLLMKRVPHFKLKSASDFMIENGLSLNVMAINTRIGEVLNHHFRLNLTNHRIQSNKRIYESVETSLRKGCDKMGVPLAYLSRMLYNYSEKDTISYILEDL